MKYISTRLSVSYNTYQAVKKSWKYDALKVILDEFLVAWNYFRTSYSVWLAQVIFKEKFGIEKKSFICGLNSWSSNKVKSAAVLTY